MSLQKYQPGQISSILNFLLKQNNSGILSLKTEVDSWQHQRSSLLILRNGSLVYGGTEIPKAEELCRRLGEALKPNLIKAALSVTVQKVSNPQSVIELLDMLVRIRVFTWQEVEALIYNKILLIIEKFIYYPGEARWEPGEVIDIAYGQDRHGFNLSDLRRDLEQRQQQWRSYHPTIPSIDAVPVISPQQFERVNNSQVQEHFRNSVDGRTTLIEIAEKLGRDPLKIAKNYYTWASNGWVSFIDVAEATRTKQAVSDARAKISATLATMHAQENVSGVATALPQVKTGQNLPIVLSVDDSAIIQKTIERALQDRYTVLLASNATEALKILNQQPVRLLLLDLTMPDVDGLEFCRSLRQMPQFKDLPIVMVTARDGLINKMKGQIAGTNKYLTKPFSSEQLRDVVGQYING